MNKYAPCPCHSNLAYKDCCRPYHTGAHPDKADVLMRSRYCAFALSLPDYVMGTTSPKNPDYEEDKANWKETIQTFAANTQFKSLAILDASQDDTKATVTFKVVLIQSLLENSFTERSTFEKVDGRWLYLSGEMIEGNADYSCAPATAAP